MTRPVVMIESPYRGRGVEAIRYLACCYLDSIDRGECPIATHSQYPLALDESDASRRIGKECHRALCQLWQINGASSGLNEPFQTPRVFYVDTLESGGVGWNGTAGVERRVLRGRARNIWLRGEWPSRARWSSTNESEFNCG